MNEHDPANMLIKLEEKWEQIDKYWPNKETVHVFVSGTHGNGLASRLNWNYHFLNGNHVDMNLFYSLYITSLTWSKMPGSIEKEKERYEYLQSKKKKVW